MYYREKKVVGYVIGIEGQVMFGLGQTRLEAWRDAIAEVGSKELRKYKRAVEAFPIGDEDTLCGALEMGDGYRNNMFSYWE